MGMQVRSLALLSGLRIWCCCELWCRLQTWAQILRCCGCGVGQRLQLWFTPSLGTSICLSASPKKTKEKGGWIETEDEEMFAGWVLPGDISGRKWGRWAWARGEADSLIMQLKPQPIPQGIQESGPRQRQRALCCALGQSPAGCPQQSSSLVREAVKYQQLIVLVTGLTFFYLFTVFLGLQPQHREVPRLGVKSEL